MKKTGWGLGLDGKWRYEIADNKAFLEKTGIFSNPDIMRFKEFENKFIMGTITQSEVAEIRLLSQSLQSVRKQPMYLSEFLGHDELFRAYPELEKTRVEFVDLEDGTNGEYIEADNIIRIEKSLNNAKAPSTMLHEVQHAIQVIEGIEGGGSPREMFTSIREQARRYLLKTNRSKLSGFLQTEHLMTLTVMWITL